MNGSRISSFGRWQRRLSLTVRRNRLIPGIEVAAGLALIASLATTYLVLAGGKLGDQLVTPPFAALLLIANLIPAIALIVLAGRRLARKRAGAEGRSGGQMHVRLVAIFSLIASLPVLVLAVSASLLFQYGFEFWYSARARSMFENANQLAQASYSAKQERIIRETELMASDLSFNLSVAPLESSGFRENFAYQVYLRELSEGAIIRFTRDGRSQSLVLVNPYDRPSDNWVPASVIDELRKTRRTVFKNTPDRMQAITPFPGTDNVYVYAARVSNPQELAQTKRFGVVLNNYNDLVERSRKLQLQFNAALFLMALLLVGVAVWIALNVADRLVKPVTELADAARRVSGGDLKTRVSPPRSRDEVSILARVFNQMTRRLEVQRDELVSASDLADRRRAFIEAVLSGVSAGVVAVDHDRRVRIMNRPATQLLRSGGKDVQGEPLGRIAPALENLLVGREQEGIVQLEHGDEQVTLAVKVTEDEAGHVLTFDDITAQLSDQRRAAWADVARRIAHEIKNPLTPIQLAAERLKRRFGAEIRSDPATFEQLTETIVRQVADLRRMVDEFSSFARMPKPVFRKERLIDICRQAAFLHEVAHPQILFEVDAAQLDMDLTCDRRQLGQALTNLIKNSVEAIEARKKDLPRGQVRVKIEKEGESFVLIAVTDNGVGLPHDRERLAEPYVTTRERGTGLGLAIVKKIVEEHGGTLGFADQPPQGTCVTLRFDLTLLDELAAATAQPEAHAKAENPKKRRRAAGK